MAEFPKLKTGAVAQYPLGREVESRTRVLEFLDGAEQRIRLSKPRRRWRIALEMLDEGEAARIDAFVAQHLETLESFVFTDPFSGVRYESCVVEGDGHEVRAESGWRCGMTLTIAEEAA